jgi:phage terminase small subunit
MDWQYDELSQAAEAADLIAQCRDAVEAEGLTTVDRYGQVRQHPLLTVQRDARNVLLRALRQLGLDDPPPRVPGDDVF